MKPFLPLFLLFVSIASAAPVQINDFDLVDQHHKTRSYRFPKSKITVMTVADHKGSEQLEPWISHVYERFGNKIDIDGVADLSRVPTPLRGMLRIAFRNQLGHSVMLDWDGSVVRQFDYEKGKANVYVLDARGRILKHFSGQAGPPALLELTQAVKSALAMR